jgi:hypothetical protein
LILAGALRLLTLSFVRPVFRGHSHCSLDHSSDTRFNAIEGDLCQSGDSCGDAAPNDHATPELQISARAWIALFRDRRSVYRPCRRLGAGYQPIIPTAIPRFRYTRCHADPEGNTSTNVNASANAHADVNTSANAYPNSNAHADTNTHPGHYGP